MSEKNGRHERPRTPSHAPREGPTATGAGGSTPDPADAATGRTEALAGPAKTDGPYGGVARNEHGHFGRGNKAAAGNGNARRMQEFRRQFMDAIHEGTVPALAKKLQVAALSGDMDATRLIFDYVMGKPTATAAVELSGPAGEPLGVNFHAVTAIVLDALADDPAKRIEVAARLMEVEDARDAQS